MKLAVSYNEGLSFISLPEAGYRIQHVAAFLSTYTQMLWCYGLPEIISNHFLLQSFQFVT
jgi:hypothetical protein